ncbi:cyclic nucleotide-binding domain-containing protein [Caldimonas sp. KR1-144]|uniref:cyclic nucleotide-binding domain-containing protein n=1 Tax=Caldimonas sp. KR1-144 TaxID=3400911 RepID=UPI003C0FE58A
MKSLLKRLTGTGAARQQPTAAVPNAADGDDEDSGFFSTMFLERGDDAPQLVAWRTRARAIGVQPFDSRQGSQMLARLWAADRHVVALDTAELDRMAEQFDFVTVPEGQEVIGQDEQGDYLVIVLDGTLAVDRLQPWGGRARLAEARAGDMLGEMSLLDAGARFSACTTLTPSVIAVLDAERLDRLVASEPRLALALVATLARRLSLRLRQVSSRLSALLSGG